MLFEVYYLWVVYSKSGKLREKWFIWNKIIKLLKKFKLNKYKLILFELLK